MQILKTVKSSLFCWVDLSKTSVNKNKIFNHIQVIIRGAINILISTSRRDWQELSIKQQKTKVAVIGIFGRVRREKRGNGACDARTAGWLTLGRARRAGRERGQKWFNQRVALSRLLLHWSRMMKRRFALISATIEGNKGVLTSTISHKYQISSGCT